MRDKQLVVLEKFLNSQENVKLPFLPFVVEMLVLGSIPLSVGIEMRVFCLCFMYSEFDFGTIVGFILTSLRARNAPFGSIATAASSRSNRLSQWFSNVIVH